MNTFIRTIFRYDKKNLMINLLISKSHETEKKWEKYY